MHSEMRAYRDRQSGVEVTQLTGFKGHSHHFYFTNPGWYAGGRKLLFGSDRHDRTNLYGVDLTNGEIEQVTDLEPVALPRELEFIRACKNPVREEAYFWHDRKLMAVDLESRAIRILHEVEPMWCVSMTNGASDGAHVYFGVWEDLSDRFPVDILRGYVGFVESWEARPLSRVVRVAVAGGAAETVFEEDYWIGHVNTSPTQANLLTFCHEGPWTKVDNRIWGLDAETGKAWKIRPRAAEESIGHEYWLADGLRIGYHGRGGDNQPFLGRIRYDNSERIENDFPGETGHVYSCDESLIVGDGGGVIRMWAWREGRYDGPRLLCRHDSSSHIQQTHPHPRISPDGKRVVFTSDRTGYGNVYMAPLAEFESLPEIEEEGAAGKTYAQAAMPFAPGAR